MEQYLFHKDWAPDVKAALERLIDTCKAKDGSTKHAYAVFDFDNTTSIFDIEEQLCIYQLSRMAFAMEPVWLRRALLTDLPEPKKMHTISPYGTFCLMDWVDDITLAYRVLWESYGPFTAKGLSEKESAEVRKNPYWSEFAVKMSCLYELVCEIAGSFVSDAWLTYWFSNMTQQELYDLTIASSAYRSARPTERVVWSTGNCFPSKTGACKKEWIAGLSVSENQRELMKALHDNGIDVWICSASAIDAVRAGIDYFGLHDSVTGLIGMTAAMKFGVFVPVYDYETGYEYISEPGGGWRRGTHAHHTQTNGEGKVTAIRNVLWQEYGNGPVAGFMDSTGDFAFCTEFSSMRLCVCFNRGNRPVTCGGGLIAALAMHQRDELHLNYDRASAQGDTLYVLQGRDENGMRRFLPMNASLRLGETRPHLFADESVERLLTAMRDMSTKEAVETFSKRTEADDRNSRLPGLAYGFTDDYCGYHSI